MKKLIPLIVAILVVFVYACNDVKDPPPGHGTPPPDSSQPKPVPADTLVKQELPKQ